MATFSWVTGSTVRLRLEFSKSPKDMNKQVVYYSIKESEALPLLSYSAISFYVHALAFQLVEAKLL